MRLFIAVGLPTLWKDRMDTATYYLRTHTEHCIPTPRGNFHITLCLLYTSLKLELRLICGIVPIRSHLG